MSNEQVPCFTNCKIVDKLLHCIFLLVTALIVLAVEKDVAGYFVK